jgi:nitric oxide reductase subunit B
LGFVLIKLTEVDREIVDKWIYIVAGLAAISGIIGTGHHYYWVGTPYYWVYLGGFFSALEPLSFLGVLIYAIVVLKRKVTDHPNRLALYWAMGCAINAAVGAGVLGFAHTLPAINQWTHGTQVTAAHGHLAFWGAYAMLNLALIHFAVPGMYKMKSFNPGIGFAAFWIMNIGMYGMVVSLAAAGIIQSTLERFLGQDFLAVQEVMSLWFGTRLFFGALFAVGGFMFIWEYFHGKRVSLEQPV